MSRSTSPRESQSRLLELANNPEDLANWIHTNTTHNPTELIKDSEMLLKVLNDHADHATVDQSCTFLTTIDAQKQGYEYTRAIWSSFDTLHGIIVRYEPQIRKKWKKLSFAKREALVKEAWPNISAKRNEVLHFMYHRPSKDYDYGITRDNCLLPYVSVEDTCRDNSHFLGLLHHRARTSPEKFVKFDNEVIQAAFKSGALDRMLAVDAYMQLVGGRNCYGKLIRSEEIVENMSEETGLDLYLQEDALPMADVLVVLEAQSKLLSFLVKMAKLILTPKVFDISDPAEDSPLPPPDVMTSLSRQKNPSKTWTTTAETHILQPFTGPPKFNLTKIRDIVSAKYAEAQDKLWLLQNDPQYMYYRLKEYDEHRYERGAGDKSHPDVDKPVFFDRVAGKLAQDTTHDIMVWAVIGKHVDELYGLERAHGHETMPGRNTPQVYERVLVELNALVERCFSAKIQDLWPTVIGSPTLRQEFYRASNSDPFKAEAVLSGGRKPTDLFKSDRLLWILISLPAPEYNTPFSTSRLLDELDLLIMEYPAQSARLTSFILNLISDLAFYNDILTMLRHRRTIYDKLPDPHITTLFEGPWKALRLLVGDRPQDSLKLGRFVRPYTRFMMPTGKRDAEWLKRKEEVHKMLNTFWMVVDNKFRDVKTGDGGSDDNLAEMLENLNVKTEKPMLPQLLKLEEKELDVERGKASVVQPIHSHRRKKSVHFPDPDHLFTIPTVKHSPAAVDEPLSPKLKVNLKTRLDNSEAAVGSGVTSLASPKIPILERFYKTLVRLFPFPKDEDDTNRAQIEWKDFVSCMIALGFIAEKMRGSAWLFTKNEMSLTAHEPHPEHKMSVWHARFLTKRLTRRFGWEWGRFEAVKEEKTA